MSCGEKHEKILVADDEESVCQLYSEELSGEGYEVISTSDCDGLMEMIEQYKPDLVVLDIKMGEHDGLDLLQEIRNVHYNMPVILCSGYSSFSYDMKSIAADSYVVKSADLAELKARIRVALQEKPSTPAEKPVKQMEMQGQQGVPPSIFVG